jgi:hypothetical protein
MIPDLLADDEPLAQELNSDASVHESVCLVTTLVFIMAVRNTWEVMGSDMPSAGN